MILNLTRTEWRRIERGKLFQWFDHHCRSDAELEYWWRFYVDLLLAWWEDSPQEALARVEE